MLLYSKANLTQELELARWDYLENITGNKTFNDDLWKYPKIMTELAEAAARAGYQM